MVTLAFKCSPLHLMLCVVLIADVVRIGPPLISLLIKLLLSFATFDKGICGCVYMCGYGCGGFLIGGLGSQGYLLPEAVE